MTAAPAGERPRLSFLTPAYRTEAYLPATIASVQAQTHPSWELVVVDNGRSDEIAAIVASAAAADPRVRLVRQENRGYAGGVAAAAAVARGEVFSVLDSDDEVAPEFVATVLDQLDRHPAVGAVGGDASLVPDGAPLPFRQTHLGSTGNRPPAAGGEPLTVEQVLSGRVPYYTGAIRRAAWEAVGGYRPGVESDVLCWLRLARDHGVRLLPDRLGRYRLREQSLSHDPERIEAFETSLIRTFQDFAEESGDSGHLSLAQRPVRRLRYHQALRRARWAFVDGDVAAAGRHARDACRQQVTVRAAAIVVLLQVAPGLLTRVHPLKQQLSSGGHRVRQRLLAPAAGRRVRAGSGVRA